MTTRKPASAIDGDVNKESSTGSVAIGWVRVVQTRVLLAKPTPHLFKSITRRKVRRSQIPNYLLRAPTMKWLVMMMTFSKTLPLAKRRSLL